MDKTTIKAFIAWLETASEEEIEAKRRELLHALERMTLPETRADARLGLRLIDEEALARMELGRSRQG